VTQTESTEPPHGWAGLLAEPRRPVAIRNRPSAPWLVVATVSIGAFLGQLDLAAALAWPRTPNLRSAATSGTRSSPGDDVVGVKL
jgi:hypothetical protein